MNAYATALLALIMLGPALATAQPPGPDGPAPAPNGGAPAAQEGPTIGLPALLERLGREMDREFILDRRASLELRAANTTLENADYESLLALLRVNGLIAIETAEDQILIVPDALMRSAPSPLVQDNDASISDHQVVTRVITVPVGDAASSDDAESMPRAPMLVPVLRPMVPPSAHLVATNDRLIITDRYDNVRRMTAIIEALVE